MIAKCSNAQFHLDAAKGMKTGYYDNIHDTPNYFPRF